MELLIQILLAAGLTASFSRFYEIRLVALTGIIGGLVPYLEGLFLIPLSPAERYLSAHTTTYSLVLWPIMAFICAVLVFALRRFLESQQVVEWQETRRPRPGSGSILVSRQFELYRDSKVPPVGPPLSFPRLYRFSLLALLGPLLYRATTIEGVGWLWPFLDKKFQGNLLHPVDFFALLCLLAGLVGAQVARDKKPARWGILAFLAYCAIAGFQRERAEKALQNWADEQNYVVEGTEALPTWSNLNLKRGLLKTSEGVIHSCAINLPLIGSARIYPGESFPPRNPARSLGLLKSNRAARQMDSFQRACDSFVALVESDGSTWLMDLRFSPIPNQAIPRIALKIPRPLLPDARLPRVHRTPNMNSLDRLTFFRMWMGQDLPENDS